jgi:histidinol-phosphate aminotransferase
VEQKQVLLGPGFSLDPDAVIKAADRHTKVIFMCSPNNPTSNTFDREAMEKIVDRVNCIVVVDEAYIDFSRGEGMLSKVPAKPNLVVLQTLSKAWGLAGIRLGMVFGHPELIRFLSRVKYPYNINTLTLTRAIECVARRENRDRWIRLILEERDRLTARLGSLEFVQRIYPSDANFLLVKVKDPSHVYRYLLDKGIVVRDRSTVPLCEGCLRITVGTKKENQALYEALTSYGKA